MAEDNNNFLKKAAKLALAGGAAYMLHKDPEGALQVSGELAGDALKERQELIKQRGEQLAKDKEYFRQRADLLFANRQEQYRVDSEKTGEMNNALQSLASSSALGSTKREIALGALTVKGIIPSTGTKIETGSGLDLQLQNEMARIQEVTGEDGKVTGYKYIGDAMPVKPQLSDFYDESLVTKAEEDISKGTFSTLSQKLFNKEDKGSKALETLQADMNSGYQKALDSPFRSSDDKVEVEFKARPESSAEEGTVAGTAIISKNSGETINLNIPAAFPLVYQDDDLLTSDEKSDKASQTAIFNRIENNFKSQTDDQSSAFVQDTFNAIQATLPKADLEVLSDYAGSKVLGTKAEGAHLYNRTQTLIMEIAEANYHKAGWETGNDANNNKQALLQRLEFELPRRIISLSTDTFGPDNPVEGTYIIPAHILPLYVGLPDKVKSIDDTNVMVDTMPYLQEELNKTLEQFGEDEGKTMAAVASILDAKVAEILYPQEEASEIKSEIATVSEDGQSYTIGGETDTFKSLQELLPQLDEAQKSAIPSSVMEQYNIWLGTQESGSSEVFDKKSVDNQMQEIVPDVSKMNLSEAIEKNLVTADYLNNLSYEAPSGSQQEMFGTGGNNMMSVGDTITTQDGTKYESYPDTVVNEFDRPVTTIRFRPITEE
jgi:5'(3')-deoxyribonucleotidase|tara:strand:- start:4285 stop:6264 length:1980 start_codon:yes stop_codon:yes gene_type:complete